MPGSATRTPAVPLLVLLGLIQAMWPLTMDLYLPAFPEVGNTLGAEPQLVQLTLTGAFAGMAIGQLVTGPLSDAVGRMRPLVVVLVVYTAATAWCAVAPTIGALVAGRFVQGLGAAAGSVIAIAIVRDRSSGTAMVRLLARLQLVSGFFVVTSPALGAQLLRVVDWRGLFWLLFGYGLLLAAGAAVLLVRRWETNPPERRALRRGATPLDDYRVLLRDGGFRMALAVGALQWAAMMAYMASSAFLFQDVFHLDPTGYALVFGGHGALMIAGAQLGARLAPRAGVRRVLLAGTIALPVVALALLLVQLLASRAGLAGFVIPLFLFTTVFGFVSPTIQSTALADHALRAGTAASLLGAANMVSGAIAAPVAGALGEITPAKIAALMLGGTLAALVVALVAARRRIPRGGRLAALGGGE